MEFVEKSENPWPTAFKIEQAKIRGLVDSLPG